MHACIDVGCTGDAMQMHGCLVVGGWRGAWCVVGRLWATVGYEYTSPVLVHMVVWLTAVWCQWNQGGLYGLVGFQV